VASIPAVKALEGRYKARGLRVVSVTKEDDRAEVEATAKEHGMDYPGFLDIDSAWSRASGVQAIPAFIVIDKSGKLAYRHAGKLTEDSDSFRKMAGVVEQALGR
jgi:hypothetical protein